MGQEKVKQSVSKKSNEEALHYMKTLIDVARESFLILNSDLTVISANPIFYQTFHVSVEETKTLLLYELGNGQWNIPRLKELLEEILPEKKTVKDYEVTHKFESIGEKTMLLNANQIDSSQLIVLAIEDITKRKNLETKLAEYTKGLEVNIAERATQLADRVKELEQLNKTMVGRELKMVELKKENENLKNLIKNGKNN